MMEQAEELTNAVSVFDIEGLNGSQGQANTRKPKLVAKPSPGNAQAKAEPKKVLAKTGTDDGDWEEF
jgi:hypothetical protein